MERSQSEQVCTTLQVKTLASLMKNGPMRQKGPYQCTGETHQPPCHKHQGQAESHSSLETDHRQGQLVSDTGIEFRQGTASSHLCVACSWQIHGHTPDQSTQHCSSV